MDEFKRDHRIDPLQLDVEVTHQAELFYKYAEMSIEARAKVDKAKLDMEACEARLALLCRKRPEKFKLDKVTEASIKSAVLVSENYAQAQAKWLKAKKRSALLDKKVAAMEMKKRMLESLITLHGQQYFAGPSTPRDLGKAWMLQKEQAAERVKKRQRIRIRKRKK